MFGNLGTPEILIIGLVILVLFGAKQPTSLPKKSESQPRQEPKK